MDDPPDFGYQSVALEQGKLVDMDDQADMNDSDADTNSRLHTPGTKNGKRGVRVVPRRKRRRFRDPQAYAVAHPFFVLVLGIGMGIIASMVFTGSSWSACQLEDDYVQSTQDCPPCHLSTPVAPTASMVAGNMSWHWVVAGNSLVSESVLRCSAAKQIIGTIHDAHGCGRCPRGYALFGHTNDTYHGVCVPVCHPMLNCMHCIAVNTCGACRQHYKLEDGVCVKETSTQQPHDQPGGAPAPGASQASAHSTEQNGDDHTSAPPGESSGTDHPAAAASGTSSSSSSSSTASAAPAGPVGPSPTPTATGTSTVAGGGTIFEPDPHSPDWYSIVKLKRGNVAVDYVHGMHEDGVFVRPCSEFDVFGRNFVIRVNMGNVVDYFSPATSVTSPCDMLLSHSKHLWSTSEFGPFIKPTYYDMHYGGSTCCFPMQHGYDARAMLSFWGGGVTMHPGGCCSNDSSKFKTHQSQGSWGIPFSLHIRSTRANVTREIIPISNVTDHSVQMAALFAKKPAIITMVDTRGFNTTTPASMEDAQWRTLVAVINLHYALIQGYGFVYFQMNWGDTQADPGANDPNGAWKHRFGCEHPEQGLRSPAWVKLLGSYLSLSAVKEFSDAKERQWVMVVDSDIAFAQHDVSINEHLSAVHPCAVRDRQDANNRDIPIECYSRQSRVCHDNNCQREMDAARFLAFLDPNCGCANSGMSMWRSGPETDPKSTVVADESLDFLGHWWNGCDDPDFNRRFPWEQHTLNDVVWPARRGEMVVLDEWQTNPMFGHVDSNTLWMRHIVSFEDMHKHGTRHMRFLKVARQVMDEAKFLELHKQLAEQHVVEMTHTDIVTLGRELAEIHPMKCGTVHG